LGASLAPARSPARAEAAPSDSVLRAYVRALSDTTDAWYGSTVAPLDTAGLDSALHAGLSRIRGGRAWAGGGGRRGVRFAWWPALGFNRADGAQLGAGLGLRTSLPGELSGRAQWTTGTHDLLGEGAYAAEGALARFRSRISFRLAAGRASEAFDRDH